MLNQKTFTKDAAGMESFAFGLTKTPKTRAAVGTAARDYRRIAE
jgi:hypothetical protein